MSNIADLIEEYILRRLAEQQNGQVELRRTDIADEISCAPSQISYVLNTRFTHDKGFCRGIPPWAWVALSALCGYLCRILFMRT